MMLGYERSKVNHVKRKRARDNAVLSHDMTLLHVLQIRARLLLFALENKFVRRRNGKPSTKVR